jgi:hypothetical protein
MKSILDPLVRYTTQHLYSGAKRKALANWNSKTAQGWREREAEQGGQHIERTKYYTVGQSDNRRGKQLIQLADAHRKQPVAPSSPYR